jgi:RNA-directed DNA polymerase
MMNGRGKSDSSVVPQKPPNKARAAAAEAVEGRGLAKGNSPERNAFRTQSRGDAPSALERVREAARKDRQQRFTALLHHVYDVQRLHAAYRAIKRDAAPGVDGETWQHYGENLEANLRDLSERLKRGAYRAKPVRRAYIAKADGRQRPLGVPALEDKIVQRAAVEVLNAIYETDFLGFSYGFRPAKSAHQALDALTVGIMTKKVGWVLDADIRSFLDRASHYTSSVDCGLKRSGWAAGNLIRKPFRRPQLTCMACSSPRFTRCKIVWRETPSRWVALSIVT